MLGDPIYQGVDQCIVRRIGRHEAPENVDKDVGKYVPLITTTCYLTNYLHRGCLGFTYIVLEHNNNEDGEGWDGDM